VVKSKGGWHQLKKWVAPIGKNHPLVVYDLQLPKQHPLAPKTPPKGVKINPKTTTSGG
jgi:hypothetical protein